MEATAFADLNFANDVDDINGPLASGTNFDQPVDAAASKSDASTDADKNGDKLSNIALGKRLLEAGVDEEVASVFCDIVVNSGLIKESEVDARVIESIKHYPSAAAVAALREFKRCDVSAIDNKFGYLFGIMRSWKQRIESGADPEEEQSDAVRRGADDSQIAALLQRTGYKLEIGASQRRYGPPPDWTGEQPGRDCEVYVGRVPKECLEDEVVPVLERFGEIYDVRIMLDVMTRESKGFLFATYKTAEAAKRCLEELNNFTMKPGTKPLKTGACSPNTRIYVGNVPKHKSRDELHADISRVVPGVSSVITYPCADNPRKKNRGFCFVDFESHRLAGSALKRLEKIANRVWNGSEIYVEWADPIDEVDASALERVKTVFVNNISSEIDETKVRERFGEFGKIQELKRAKDYAFITYEERDSALRAVETMNGVQLGKNSIGAQLARPLSEKAREMKHQRKKFRDRDHVHPRERDESRPRKYDYDYSGYSRSSSYGGSFPPFPAAAYPPYGSWPGSRPPIPMMPVPYMPVPYPGMPMPYGRSSASSSRYADRDRSRERSRDSGRDRGSANRSRSASARPPSTSFGGYPAPPAYPAYPMMPPHTPFAVPHGMPPVDAPARKPMRSTFGAPRTGDRGLKRTAGAAKTGDANKRSRYDAEGGNRGYYGGGYGAAPSGGYGASAHSSGDAGAALAGSSSFPYGGFGYGAGGPGGRSFADDQFADDHF